jgi:hypothetical protein
MLKDILAISGQPGLFKMVSKGSSNFIVESLLNGKRFPAYSTNKVISLEDIAIFTTSGEVPLVEVLKKIAEKEDSKQTIDPKSSAKILKDYFKQILPEYDEDRVYVSNIKKVLLWYNMLQENDLIKLEDEEVPETDAEAEATKETQE